MAAGEQGAFSLQVSQQGDQVTLVLAGSIDEQTVLELPDVRGRPVVIDAAGVKHINSMGVRAWIEMMSTLSAQARDIVITRLPAILVTQASMISSFLGSARVQSFVTPWVCLNCDQAQEQSHGGADPVPETIPCPSCGGAMELDWDRESYLAFRRG